MSFFSFQPEVERMPRTNFRLSAIGLLGLLVLSACSAPRGLKNASRLQLESLQASRQGVEAYLDLTDQILVKAKQFDDYGDQVELVFGKIDEILKQETVPDDPLTASDQVAQALFSLRRKQQSADDPVSLFRQQHRLRLRQLNLLLELVEQSQELIHHYLTADVAPTSAQLEELNTRLQQLEGLGGNR